MSPRKRGGVHLVISAKAEWSGPVTWRLVTGPVTLMLALLAGAAWHPWA